ncbi:MAG: helix-turn-helix domain-containing protein [Betaproteobacteria bacterium]|nr:helix-turn-helix domain-containing protein [Betaproteobacteria bacterium]
MNDKKQADPVHAGGYFDDFLHEQGIFEEVNAQAVKKVISWQIAEEMKRQGLSKVTMAKRMGTSRSSLERLLDPENDALALSTLARAASVLGKEVQVNLV